MITFTISDDNNITAYPSAEEARTEAGSITFDSSTALAEVSADWSASRLVEIWNSIPGNTPVKKFENRKKALGRIWKGIQGLAGAAEPKAAKLAKPLKTFKKAKPDQGGSEEAGLEVLRRPRQQEGRGHRDDETGQGRDAA